MKRSLCSLLTIVSLASMGVPPAEATDLTNSVAATYTDAGLGSMPYRVFLPDGWQSATSPLPVMLFLHGAGSRGTNNTSQVIGVDNLFIATKTEYPMIVVAPQCPTGKQWAAINAGDNWSVGAYHNPIDGMAPITGELQMALNILDEVQEDYDTDARRVYMTGLSMGGYGTWDAIARFPDRFAAALPLSGGGNLDSASDLADMPIWAVHNTGDTIVPPTGTTDMIAALRAAGGTPEDTLLPGGHGPWDGFYMPHKPSFLQAAYDASDGTELYPWILSQQSAVPEPSMAVVLAAGMVGLLRRVRS